MNATNPDNIDLDTNSFFIRSHHLSNIEVYFFADFFTGTMSMQIPAAMVLPMSRREILANGGGGRMIIRIQPCSDVEEILEPLEIQATEPQANKTINDWEAIHPEKKIAYSAEYHAVVSLRRDG